MRIRQTLNLRVNFGSIRAVRSELTRLKIFNNNVRTEFIENKNWFSSDFIIMLQGESEHVLPISEQIEKWTQD
jgi:hypothetical protein